MVKDLSFFLAREMDINARAFSISSPWCSLFTICTCSHLCPDNIHTCNTLQCVQDNTETVHGYTQSLASFLCNRHMQIMDWLLPFYTPAFRLKQVLDLIMGVPWQDTRGLWVWLRQKTWEASQARA